MTRISVIIASYRQPQFLGRAIESCLTQDHDDLEVIIVEDASRDSSLGLALSFAADPRVRVVEAAQNGGLGKARNIGIAHSTGEYLCFLDSDDYLLDRSLSARLAALPAALAEYGDDLAGVYGDWQHVGEDLDYPDVRNPRAAMPLVSGDTYTGENVFICSAPLVRRDIVVEAGGFPEGLPMLEDFGLWARLIARGGVFVPVHHVVATYRQRPNSMLRGDGVVVMAEYAEVINRWMGDNDVPLADGGAMAAWLAGELPNPYGRMSWTVPSMLGELGPPPPLDDGETDGSPSRVLDFMTKPNPTGFDDPSPVIDAVPTPAETFIGVGSLEESLAVVGLIAAQEHGGERFGVVANDPQDWTMLWPLALIGVVAHRADEFDGPISYIEDLPGRNSAQLVAAGAAHLGENEGPRSQTVVYVPEALIDYPARDAWISTALHAATSLDRSPVLVADPAIHEVLGGWRAEMLSLQSLAEASLVIAPVGEHLGFISVLAPTLVFDPMSNSARSVDVDDSEDFEAVVTSTAELVSALERLG